MAREIAGDDRSDWLHQPRLRKNERHLSPRLGKTARDGRGPGFQAGRRAGGWRARRRRRTDSTRPRVNEEVPRLKSRPARRDRAAIREYFPDLIDGEWRFTHVRFFVDSAVL